MSGGFWHKESAWLRVVTKASMGIAVISAFFVFAVAVLTVAGWLQVGTADPLKDGRVSALREELRANPDRDDLREELRSMDLLARRVYFSNLEHVRGGAQLLFIGMAVLVLSAGIAAQSSRRLPDGQDRTREESWRSMNTAWKGVVVGAVVAGIMGLGAAPLLERVITLRPDEAAPDEVVGPDRPDPEPAPVVGDVPSPVVERDPELARNWPGFLGPQGRGVAEGRSVPNSWDYSEDEGVAWFVMLDRYGYSSPVVWGDRVFIAQGDDEVRELLCLELASGDEVWKAEVGPYDGTPEDPGPLFTNDMHAACTPVTDGKRVYVMFGNGDIACLDFNGEEVWGKSLGKQDIEFGYSSSPVLYGDKLIVQLEEGKEASFIAALDPATGTQLWKAKRPDTSWGSPVIYDHDGTRMILCASGTDLSAHSLEDGRQLWIVKGCLGGEVGTSPSWAEDMVYVSSPAEGVRAFRISEKAELVWHWDEDPADMASPLAFGGDVFIASLSGYLYCIDGKTGETKWEAECDSPFYASPVVVDGIIHAITRKGTMYSIPAAGGDAISRKSAEAADTVPAFVGKRVLVRAPDEVICYSE